MTPSRRSLLRALAAWPVLESCLLSAGALATTSVRAQSPTLDKVSVISFGGGFNLPLWAARDQGFFTRNAIDAQLSITSGSKELFTGMLEGKFHIAITAMDNILAYQEGQGEVKFDPPSDFFAFMGSDDGF